MPKKKEIKRKEHMLDKRPELKDKILEKLRKGNFPCTAYGSVGVCKSSYYRYLEANREYREEVKKAEVYGESVVVENMHADAINGDNTARIFFLKHRFRERWGEHVQITTGESSQSGVPTMSELFDRTIHTTSIEVNRLNAKSAKSGLSSEEHKMLVTLNKSILDIAEQQQKHEDAGPERRLTDEELVKLAPTALKLIKSNTTGGKK